MSYAGDVTVTQCWKSLEADEKAQLVDVRTVPEWQFVGVPDLSSLGKKVIFAQWQMYPDMAVNPSFEESVVSELEARGCEKDSPVYVICRSGARSMSAASLLTAAGYTNAMNVLSGFEGDQNEAGRRGLVGGWKFEECPWVQM